MARQRHERAVWWATSAGMCVYARECVCELLTFFMSAVAIHATSQGKINTNKAFKEQQPDILNHYERVSHIFPLQDGIRRDLAGHEIDSGHSSASIHARSKRAALFTGLF